jgi:DnaJ-class molecular chaperone
MMFKACPVCNGWGIPQGLMIFRIEICPKCKGQGFINEHTGLPVSMDDLWELVEDKQKERGVKCENWK